MRSTRSCSTSCTPSPGSSRRARPSTSSPATARRPPTPTRSPFHVISGYRSPTTNAALREQGRGVASGSLHIVGKAIDIRVPGVALTVVRGSALALGAGGVGYYPRSDFVHVDVGRVRCW